MKAGDQSERNQQWAEALAEFELALAAKPDDPRALAEVGWTAYHAGKLARAKQASIAAVAAAASDAKLRAAALFNLGLAIERDLPHAAASLFAESNQIRGNATVAARLAHLARDNPKARDQSDGDKALLAEVHVASIKLPTMRKPAKPLDAALIAIINTCDLEWQGAAGKMVVFLDKATCSDTTTGTAHSYACSNPKLAAGNAKKLVDNLAARKVATTHVGNTVVYTASIRCTSYDVEMDDGRLPPDVCEVVR